MEREKINFLKKNHFHIYPKMLQFEITLRCPFNCSQCYKKNLQKKDMDYEYLKSMIYNSIKKGTELITLNGGEPLLYPDIERLLSYIGKTNISTNVFSSGYGLTDTIIDILKDYSNINFYISLNGSNMEINSLSREGFEVSLNAIKMLSYENVNYGVNWVARHDNVNDFPNLLELCQNYGVSFLSITSNKLTGGGKIDSALTKEDLINLANFINERENLNPHLYIESCFSVLSTKINANKNGFSAHCYAGVSNCTVNCDGTFQPCTHLKYPEKYDSLEKYWIESKVLSELREHPPKQLEPCCNCDNNKFCSLCRAMYVETYHKFSEGVNLCKYV